MHDIKAIRDDPGAFDRAWTSRGLAPQAAALLELDERLRAAQTALQAAQSRRNEASKLIGQAKANKDEAGASALMTEVEALKDQIQGFSSRAEAARAELELRLVALPNLPDPGVPVGA